MAPHSFKRSLNYKIALTSQWDNPFWQPVRGILSFHIWLKGERRPFIPKWFLQPLFIHPHMTNHYFSLPVHSQAVRPNRSTPRFIMRLQSLTELEWIPNEQGEKKKKKKKKKKTGFLLRLNRSVSPTSSKWSHTWGSGKKLFSLIIFLVALLRDALNYSLSLSVQCECSGASATPQLTCTADLRKSLHIPFFFFFFILCNARNTCGPTSVCQCVCVCVCAQSCSAPVMFMQSNPD